MKKISILLMAMMIAVGVAAVDNKYEKSMSDAIEKLYEHQNMDDLKSVAATFERIAQAETKEWLPSYYASLSYIWMTHQTDDKEKVDQFLDVAQQKLDECKNIVSDNDEVHALQGYIYMMRVTVDPPSRGSQYSPMSMGEFQKALAINENNARALLLMGQMKYGTDQFFGNDVSDACNMIKEAAQRLDNEQPDSKLAPAWGKGMAQYLIQACN